MNLEQLKSEVSLRKARAGGANVLTLVNVDMVLEMIERIESLESEILLIGIKSVGPMIDEDVLAVMKKT